VLWIAGSCLLFSYYGLTYLRGVCSNETRVAVGCGALMSEYEFVDGNRFHRNLTPGLFSPPSTQKVLLSTWQVLTYHQLCLNTGLPFGNNVLHLYRFSVFIQFVGYIVEVSLPSCFYDDSIGSCHSVRLDLINYLVGWARKVPLAPRLFLIYCVSPSFTFRQ
jgi:hypothetical protein